MTDPTNDERVARLREPTTTEKIQDWIDSASDIRHDNDFGPTIKVLDFNAHCKSGQAIMEALQTERNEALARVEEFDYDAFQIEVSEWADKTFPQATLHSRLAHMKSELAEIEEHPSEVMEWADGLLLFIQAALHEGHKVSEIFAVSELKLAINKGRNWGEPNADGFVEHVGELARGESGE